MQGNIVHEVGIWNKQAGGVFQSLARNTSIIGNVMYNGARRSGCALVGASSSCF